MERLTELLDELLNKATVPPDSVRGHEYTPPPEPETAIIPAEELEDIDIDKLISEMEEVGLINGETEEIPTDYKDNKKSPSSIRKWGNV